MDGLSFLTICYTLFSSLAQISIAADALTLTQSISEGKKLVSFGQTFELGFFSPGNSKNRYLGIWYKQIPIQTVVWVANRDDPLTDLSGVLSISNDGNLVLLDRTGRTVWSSNSSRAAQNPVAQLLDTGNLVMIDQNGGNPESYIWQSFDYPSDTLLPGMKLGWNLKTGLNRQLTSWKNESNPSPGDYSYSVDPVEPPRVVLRKGLIKQYQSRLWFGAQYGVTPTVLNFNPFFISNVDEVYYTFQSKDNSSFMRLAMNQSGLAQHLMWSNRSPEWSAIFSVPRDQCDKYGICGANGICRINDLPFGCECLKGFTPKSPQDWELYNWSGGCIRRSPLNCSKGDGFVKIQRVKLPDLVQFWVNKNTSASECERECLNNCSCMAYTISDTRRGGSGCIVWFGDLIDMRLFSEDDTEQDLYLRMGAAELESLGNSNKKRKRLVVIVSLLVASGMLLLVLIGCRIIWKKTCKRGHESKKEDLELPMFDLTTLVSATSNFSYANKIGEGGFGPVYKGELSAGQAIAVKRLSKNSGQGLEEFKNEVVLIAKLQHRNLVRLLGCCIQGEERMLVYEYMPNRSLDDFIFDQHRSILLEWSNRYDIIMGIARGLLYLHQDPRLRIIHRDLKASNILLDSNMNPKISDFGIARTFGADQTEAKTKRIMGTYGYMSPEYAINGHFSVKSDVFSFGVLVLETVSGKKNRGFYNPDHHHNLLGHAWMLWNEGKALELMDACMDDSCIASEVLRCIQVGLLCVQHYPSDRPIMSSVVFMLGNETATLAKPKQPGFFTEWSSVDKSVEKCPTENSVTITMLEAR